MAVMGTIPDGVVGTVSSGGAVLYIIIVTVVFNLYVAGVNRGTSPLGEIFRGVGSVIRVFLGFLVGGVTPVTVFYVVMETLTICKVRCVSPAVV